MIIQKSYSKPQTLEHPSIVEKLPDPIVRYDKECRRVYVNEAWLHLNRVQKDDILGKTPIEVSTIISHMAVEYQDKLKGVIASGVPHEWEVSWKDVNDNPIVYSVRALPEWNHNGEIAGVFTTSYDITQQKLAEEEKTNEQMRHFFEKQLVGMAIISPNKQWLKVNEKLRKILGYTFEEFEVVTCLKMTHPEDVALNNELCNQLLNGEIDDYQLDKRFIHKNGSIIFTSTSVSCVRQKDGTIDYLLALIEDITSRVCAEKALQEFNNILEERIELRTLELKKTVAKLDLKILERNVQEEKIAQNEKRLKEAQEIAKVGNWEIDFPGLKLYWSDEVYRIVELNRNEFEPAYDHFLNFTHPEDRAFIDTAYSESLKNKTPYDIVHRLLMSNGKIKYVHQIGQTFYDTKGNILRSVGTIQDITEQKIIEKKIEYMAHHDALTDLPNRLLAKSKIQQRIDEAKQSETKVAVLFIDLDDFKTINDSLGHSIGDAMITLVAKRLQKSLHTNDILSRQGGDEFLLVLSSIQNIEDIVHISENLIQEFKEQFKVKDNYISLSASIGIAVYPDHGSTVESLLQNADTAMYKAKENGKNNYCFYTQQIKHNLIGLFKMQNDLKKAIKNKEFVLHYQPQIDLTKNRISGVEALIRWQHPQLGMIAPMSFISIAESTGLIVEIGTWVLYEACKQAALWHRQGIDVIVAVNISAVQFKRGNLEKIVKDALKVSGLMPKYLELELTESILINDTENILQSVKIIKEMGIKLSIDDFGTGYSSLAYLKRFAVDKLKIDQSFVKDVLKDNEDANIVKTIIQMAKNFNLISIAEGIENQEVLEVIRGYGCNEVQGYHFAKPMKAEIFEDYYMNKFTHFVASNATL